MTVVEVRTETEFNAYVEKSKNNSTLLIVDFSAAWCGPCRMFAPIFDTISEEYTAIVFIKVDVDEVATVASNCGVRAMPTFVLYKNGEKVAEIVGANEAGVRQMIMNHL